MNHGAVPAFCRLLASPNNDIIEQAVWALRNIAGDSSKCRDVVLNCGAMAPLLHQLQTNSRISMLRNVTGTLSNFCRKPYPDFDSVKSCLPTLAQLINSADDEELLRNACLALSYLSDGPNEKIQAVIDTGVPRRLVELLTHSTPSVQVPALRTVGNIVTGNDSQTQLIIDLSALSSLHALLSSNETGIRKEVVWTISNITAGNRDQIQAVIEANIMPQLIQLLRNAAEFDIRKECAWAVRNATVEGSCDQIKYLVSLGCIDPLCDFLRDTDVKIIVAALDGLENILMVGDNEMKQKGTPRNLMATWIEESEGLDRIEELKNHTDDDTSASARKILGEHYFDMEAVEERRRQRTEQKEADQADNDGATPLSASRLAGHEEVAELLLAHGRKAERAEKLETTTEEEEKGKAKKAARVCEKCGKEAEKMKKCSACRLARYCSEECQREDWKKHKGSCKKTAKGKGGKGTGVSGGGGG